MKPPFNNTYIKRESRRDKFGKIQYDPASGESKPCHFREIFGVQDSNNFEQFEADAIIWVNSNEIGQDDILYAGTKHYRVTKVISARTLFSSVVHFTKCLLQVEKESNGIS